MKTAKTTQPSSPPQSEPAAAGSAPSDPSDATETFPVVGIGASAGGLESLESFFAALPGAPGMAFVVIQHLSPDFRSMMDELLRRHTRMPVEVVSDGDLVEPNRVYLLPAKKNMELCQGRLRLSDKANDHAIPQPIDVFFRSLADDVGARAVAIVLSGSGSDGSRGLPAVKQAGGMVLAEDPASASFDGMPRSAIATGVVDGTGTPDELARGLVGQPVEPDPDLSADEAVLGLLRADYGLDFSQYKRGTVTRRIQRRMEILGYPALPDYLTRLRADEEERGRLYQDLLIGVTHFFRDTPAFEAIARQAIPSILKRVSRDEEIRVWVAGCATGEEAYSLAILFHEQLSDAQRPINIKILATDVHRTSIEQASRGLYRADQLEGVSELRRQRYFRASGDQYQVSPELRQMVVFAPHNVIRDAPFTRMHLISCRNLLIYLEPDAQRNALSLFHFGLLAGGYLMLGSSEAVGSLQQEFSVENERAKLFKKRRDVRLVMPVSIPIQASTTRKPPPTQLLPGTNKYQLLGLYDQLLDEYMPPAFLVDAQHHLVDTFGGADKFLKLTRRRPSMALVELLRGDLRSAVERALAQASLGTSTAQTPIRIEGSTRRFHITCKPIRMPGTDVGHLLVTLAQRPLGTGLSPTTASARKPEGNAQEGPNERDDVSADISRRDLATLEGELTHARETLQTTVEELQTSNEQLQATNEELVASNEELQSTNEELHSVNEELYTVNAEYQQKNTELREANTDIQHMLEGTGIGTLFLDGELRIRRYTPRVEQTFHIQPQDVGRRIDHFSHKLVRQDLLAELEDVMRTGKTVEEEVHDLDGTPFFMRILPYRALKASEAEAGTVAHAQSDEGPDADGVVLSLTDISALAAIRERLERVSAIVESSDDAIIGKDLRGIITTWNRGAERLYGYTAAEAVGQHVTLVAPAGYEDEIEGFIEAVRAGHGLDHVETQRRRKDGSLLDVSVTISPIRDSTGTIVGASAIARDVTPLKRARYELEQREAHIRLLLQSTAEAIFGLDASGRCTFCNPACARLLGYDDPDELLGRDMYEVLRLSDLGGQALSGRAYPIEAVLRSGEGSHADAIQVHRRDGSTFVAEHWSYPIAAEDGAVLGAVVTFLDVTERRAAEEEIREAAARREAFLAMLSHELRNPLAAVLAATQVMLGAPSRAELATARDVIQRQSTHMARLLDDLLDVTRITRGGIELRKSDLDARDACTAAVETLEPLLKSKQMALELELSETPLPVRGDLARLQQVVGNLISNAVRYSPAGSRVRLRAACVDDEVLIEVADEGFGIPLNMHSKIFELFVQGEGNLARSNGGLGVGLTLVKRILDLHGGRIVVHSHDGRRGTTMAVHLPCQKHAMLAARAAEPAREEPTSARRVVLVEDQDDAREMLKLLLRNLGHHVEEASNGEDGVAAIKREHPDIAFVDIGLPVLNGYEVARAVRREEALSDVVLVALTGYGTDDDHRSATRAGFDLHLTKPADPTALRRILAAGTRSPSPKP